MGFGVVHCCLKKNQSTPRPSEHPPVMGEKMSKCLGGIKGCKYKTSSWHCYYDKIYLQVIDMGGLRLQRAIEETGIQQWKQV